MKAFITGTTTIKAAISMMQTAGRDLDADIQFLGLSVLNHIELHGDYSMANCMFSAMPNGSRRNSLAAWFIKYGKLRLTNDEDVKKRFVNKKDSPFQFDKTKATNLEGAGNEQWFDCLKEKAPDEVLDVTSNLQRLIKRIEAAMAKGIKIEGAEALPALRALVPQK